MSEKKAPEDKPIELSKTTRKKLRIKTDLTAGMMKSGTGTSCNGWCTNSNGYCC